MRVNNNIRIKKDIGTDKKEEVNNWEKERKENQGKIKTMNQKE